MNITEEGLKEYIETFNSTLKETAETYLSDEFRIKLLHLSYLPAHIIGYVSTQYGIAIEYKPADQTLIEVVTGSARVEDLLVKAPKSIINVGPGLRITDSNVSVFGIGFPNTFPFRLEGREARLCIGTVVCTSGEWNRYIAYAEIYGNREKNNWCKEKAVSRAKDEVLAALVELKRAKSRNISIAEYISSFKKKTVLLLGNYDKEGKQRLNKIACILKKLGYEPLLIEDIPDNPYQDLTQKVSAIGHLARFVVIDDSSRSGHLAEFPICKQNNWVTILLRTGGRGSSWMTAGASLHSKVILEKNYDLSVPGPAIAEAVGWAEEKLRELKREFDNTYPWRNISR